jgi:hypothetical protein
MNSFTLHIWDDEGQKCCFYTVTKDDSTLNETDKFLEKYENHEIYKEPTQELVSLILDVIGDVHGAIDGFFNRHENEVKGLPNKGAIKIIKEIYHYPNFPLRLYALKVNEEIVVLFNGGIKDGATNQESSLHSNWKEACQFAKKIIQNINDGIIQIKGNRLFDENDKEEIYIV